MNNITKLIAELAKEGHDAQLVLKPKRRQWLVAVVDPNVMGKEVILCCRRGDRHLVAIHTDPKVAMERLDKLCAVPADDVGPFPGL